MIEWTESARSCFAEQMKKIEKSHNEPDFNIEELKQDLVSHIEEAAAEAENNLITCEFVGQTLKSMDLFVDDNPGKKPEKRKREPLLSRFKAWLKEPISIFKIVLPRSVWMILLIILPIMYLGILLVETEFSFISGSTGPLSIIYPVFIIVSAILLAFFEVVGIFKVFRINFAVFVAFALFLAAAAFIVEELVFESDGIFAPFSTVTIIWLWFSFAVLFLSLFYKKIPALLQIPLPAILIAGFMMCVPFTIYMLPFMAFSWILIPFLGIGLLSYSPLIAAVAFLLTGKRVLGHIKNECTRKQYIISKALTIIVICSIALYTIWFKTQWHRYDRIINRTTPGAIGQNKIYGDFPHWLKAGLYLPNTHVLDHYLSYESSIFVFRKGATFDPIAFTASLFTSKLPENVTKEKQLLLKLVRNNSHVNIDRLWSGKDLVTTSVDSHIQLYPEARIGYTEMTITVFNNYNFNRTEEAIYTILVPEGTTATKLSLWINGVEEPGRLTLKSKAKKSYNKIVGVEKRDPAVLDWIDSRTLRLRVFPVNSQSSRTVRIGLITPLTIKGENLHYNSIKLIGHPTNNAKSEIYVDIFSKDKNISLKTKKISLKELINSDDQAKEYTRKGGYTDNFTLTIPAVPMAGSFTFDDSKYTITSIPKTSQSFVPGSIFVLLSGSKSKKEWEKIIRKLYKVKKDRSRIYLVSSRVFFSEDINKTIEYLKNEDIPRYHIFPFYKLTEYEEPGKVLIVTAYEKFSIAHTDISGYDFYNKQEEYFSRLESPILVASLDKESSDYFIGLEDFNKVQIISRSKEELFTILSSGRAEIADSENHALFFSSGFAVKKEQVSSLENGTKGNDLLARLYFSRHITGELGKRKFFSDQGHDDLLAMAKYGMIVTPISSYVVLETQRDYDRFDIKKNKSKLGQTKVKKNTGISAQLGVVPEPAEWALLILCLFLVLLFYKSHLHKYMKMFRSRI